MAKVNVFNKTFKLRMSFSTLLSTYFNCMKSSVEEIQASWPREMY